MDDLNKKQNQLIKVEVAVLLLINLLFWLLLVQVDIFEQLYPYIEKYERFNIDELLLSMPLLAASLVVFSYRRWQESRDFALLLEKQTRYDELTGLYNHKTFERKVTQEFNRYKRYKEKFCTLNLCIDNFAHITKEKGYDYTDELTKNIAMRIRLNLREVDVACRWGEGCFSILCPVTLMAEAQVIAKKIRSIIEEPMLDGLKVSVCFGLMEIKEGINPEDVVKVADVALYQAQSKGPGQMVIAS